MNLIIVESPTKARTLTRYLNGEYRVEATMGHIRDLPKSTLGVDVEHEFAPSYLIPKDKQKRVKELTGLAKAADTIILATDPDREGEAIAWHVSEILRQKDSKTKRQKNKKKENLPSESEAGLTVLSSPFQRIVFHEITQSAIKEALAHPRSIDAKLVDAQQARRVLDRLVGYTLSPLLWQKLSRRWLSAGRVQSVAVRLIVEREREIAKFAKEEFWVIDGVFSPSDSGPPARLDSAKHAGEAGNQDIKRDQIIKAQLAAKDGNKYEVVVSFDLFDGKYTTTKTTIVSEQSAKDIVNDLKAPFTISAVDKKEVKRYPFPPFTTSTLQQDAGRKLYFSAKRTMSIAQKLYEEGIITYHRTDSVNLSNKFIDEARAYIKNEFGLQYLPDAPRIYQTKSKVAQEAHEAIRPTDVKIQSSQFREQNEELNKDHIRLYDLIWKRALASQAKEAIFDSTTIRITSGNGYLFETQGSVVKFDGYMVIMGRDNGEVIIPDVTVGDALTLLEMVPSQHFTNPPPRYTEASLVKTLEEKDIGRPSTYAPIISTIVERQYVTKEEKKLVPTELGNIVTDFLVRYFPAIMELPFTAAMEEKLDEIATGAAAWVPVISEFYGPFSLSVEETYKQAEKVKVPVEELSEKCPDCGNTLVLRVGRYGKFIACSTFPNCRYTRQFAEKIDMKCPKCGGDICIKKSRRGKTFYGCSNYPTCTFAAWKKEDIK